jgi:hypothetical protein
VLFEPTARTAGARPAVLSGLPRQSIGDYDAHPSPNDDGLAERPGAGWASGLGLNTLRHSAASVLPGHRLAISVVSQVLGRAGAWTRAAVLPRRPPRRHSLDEAFASRHSAAERSGADDLGGVSRQPTSAVAFWAESSIEYSVLTC